MATKAWSSVDIGDWNKGQLGAALLLVCLDMVDDTRMGPLKFIDDYVDDIYIFFCNLLSSSAGFHHRHIMTSQAAKYLHVANLMS